jgi:hypothetical protein
MGDYTYLQAYIYTCPAERVRAVLDALDEHGVGLTYEKGFPAAAVILGETYHNESVSGDTAQELATSLIDAAPEITFWTWTDPAYDWLGAGVAYTPEHGRFDFESSAQGIAQFTGPQVRKAVDEGPEAVDKLLGTAILAAVTVADQAVERMDPKERIVLAAEEPDCNHDPAALRDPAGVLQCECGALVDPDTGREIHPA